MQNYWKTDRNWLKFAVLSIYILDTGHQAIVIYETYMYLVKEIADPSLLGRTFR